jgi:hypothetical protein
MSVATASALDAATLTRRDGPFWYIGWISSLIVRIAQSAPATAIVRVRQLVVVGVTRANAVQRLMLVDSRASRNGPGCMQQPMTDGLFPLKKSRMRGTLETHRSLQCAYRVCKFDALFSGVDARFVVFTRLAAATAGATDCHLLNARYSLARSVHPLPHMAWLMRKPVPPT